jgi:Protein of unknown function (DUF1822)
MITPIDNSITFTIPLGHTAHQQADLASQSCHGQPVAERIYLNTLAIYAAESYLRCQGFEPDPTTSQSRDPVMQLLVDSADLPIPAYGKLECRRVLPDASTLLIPPEVWSDRIGYLAVLLDETLEFATLLGFIDQVKQMEIPLSDLRSLDELPAYLDQFKPVPQMDTVQLSQWLQGIFAPGWQAIETILGAKRLELALEFRSETGGVKRGKTFALGNTGSQVAVIVNLWQSSGAEREIQIEVVPVGTPMFLPSGLQLALVDAQGETLMNAQTKGDNQKMRLEFSGELGDQFDVKISLQDFSLVESFLI